MNLVYLETKLNVRPVYVNTRVDPLTTSWLWKSAAKSDSIRSFFYILNFRAKIASQIWQNQQATADFKTKMALLASIFSL